MLHTATDFPEHMTNWQIGWMAAAVTLSDIASMGAKPCAMLLAIGLDKTERLKDIMNGASACCRYAGTHIAGGDLDHHEELTIVSTGLGVVKTRNLTLRSGAVPGDLICISGLPGRAEAALAGFKRYENSLLEPVPRIHEARILAETGVTSMMDLSDGLVSSLYSMCEVSDTGFRIDSQKLPVHPFDSKERSVGWILYGGGDFELVFTIPDFLKNEIILPFYIIGEVIPKKGVFLDDTPIPVKGYEHHW